MPKNNVGPASTTQNQKSHFIQTQTHVSHG